MSRKDYNPVMPGELTAEVVDSDGTLAIQRGGTDIAYLQLVVDTVKRASVEVSLDGDDVVVTVRRHENDPTVRVVFV